MNLLKNISDQELALLIKKEDKSAFSELFERYAPRIFKFALSYLKNKDDAEELVQNVFLKIWEKCSIIDTSQNIKAFIFTITVNTIYDLIRRKNIEKAFLNYVLSTPSNNKDQTWDLIIYNEMRQMISGLVSQLPSQQQKIFNLSKLEGFSNDEIAEKMGLSKRTVENHLYRAISFLKQNFRQYS